jgi:hypothetical protein
MLAEPFECKNGGAVKNLNFKVKTTRKGVLLIALLVIAVFAAAGYAVVLEYTLNVPSTVVVVQASPSLELIATDNTTVVTSLTFGNIVQGESGSWSGYLKNNGNVDLYTFSIASPDIGSVGNVTWNMPASGDLGVGQMCPVTITLSINQTADLGSHTFTVQITGSPTITSPTKISVYASDPADPYLRDWGLTIDRPMVPEQDGIQVGFIGADAYGNYTSGSTMTLNWTFSPGPHYLIFIVGQSGGPSYGTYSGTITMNGQTYQFSGVDDYHSARINFTV